MLRTDARLRGLHGPILVALALATLAGCGEKVVVARELAQNVSLFDASPGPTDAEPARLDASPGPSDAAPAPPSEAALDAGRSQDGGAAEIDAGPPDASVPDEGPIDDGNPFDID